MSMELGFQLEEEPAFFILPYPNGSSPSDFWQFKT